MKYFPIIFLLFGLIVSISPLQALDTLSLDEALKQKRIALQVRGKGGYNGECLVLRAKNLRQESLTLLIPPGWVFASQDTNVQDLIHTAEVLLAFAPGEIRQVFLKTMCTQPGNMSPGKGEVFLAGNMAPEGMLRLAQVIAEKGYHNSTAQAAVWTVASRSHSGMVYGEDSAMVHELASVVSEATGIPLSAFDYRPRPHQITSINTSLESIIPHYLDSAKLAVYDASGQVVQQYFEGQKMEPGFRQFKVGVFHTRGDSARLFLRLMDGRRLVDEKEVFVTDTIPGLQRYHSQEIVAYEVPEATTALIGIFDEADSLNFILSEDKPLQAGYHRSTYMFGTDLPGDKVFFLKVKAADGTVLVQSELDPHGPPPVRHEVRKEQGLIRFTLEEQVDDARLVVYDENGKVVRILFENSRLYPGAKQYRYAFQHGMGPDARFSIRLETGDGEVLEEQCIHCKE